MLAVRLLLTTCLLAIGADAAAASVSASPTTGLGVGSPVTITVASVPSETLWVTLVNPAAGDSEYTSAWKYLVPGQTSAVVLIPAPGRYEARVLTLSNMLLARSGSFNVGGNTLPTIAASPTTNPPTIDTPTEDALVGSQFLVAGSCPPASTITLTGGSFVQTADCVGGRWSRTGTQTTPGAFTLRAISSISPFAPVDRRVVRSDGAVSNLINHGLFANVLPAVPYAPAPSETAQFRVEPDNALNSYSLPWNCHANTTFHERELYWLSLERTQSSGGTPWKFRFARSGGVAHGLYLPGTGNLMGDDAYTGFGLDRVLMTTWAVNREELSPLAMERTGHVHQGGSYLDGSGDFCRPRRTTLSGVRTKPFYSPILSYEATARGQLRVLTWPQASEIYAQEVAQRQERPNENWRLELAGYHSEALLETVYTDLGSLAGASAMQVDVVVMNHGIGIHDITAPWWGGVRQIRQTGGRVNIGTGTIPGIYEFPAVEGLPAEPHTAANRTGFTAYLYGAANTLSLVHGNGGMATTTQFSRPAIHQGDTARFPPGPNDNYSIIASAFRGKAQPQVLVRNEVAHVRYFLVFGPQGAAKAASERLAPYAGFNKWNFGERPSTQVELCLAKSFAGCASVQVSNVPAEAGAKPLYLMQDRYGREFFATNPYCLTEDPGDGKSNILRFVGWTVSSANAGRLPLTQLASRFGLPSDLIRSGDATPCVGSTDGLFLVDAPDPKPVQSPNPVLTAQVNASNRNVRLTFSNARNQSGQRLTLASPNSVAGIDQVGQAWGGSEGDFTFTAVAPGQYVARLYLNAGSSLQAQTSVFTVSAPPPPCQDPWQHVPGAALDIGIGSNGAVWVIGTDHVIYHWTGTGWEYIDGVADRIAVDPSGLPWVVNSAHQIFQRTNQGWKLLPGAALDIGIGSNGAVWVIGTDHVIYHWTGTGWEYIDGAADRIAVDPSGLPWVVNSAHQIFQRTSQGWKQLPGSALDIGVGANGEVWVTGTDQRIYRWNGSTWISTPGYATNISVGPNGQPWVVNGSFQIFALTSCGN